jgi:hypothetical protein
MIGELIDWLLEQAMAAIVVAFGIAVGLLAISMLFGVI